MKRALLFGLLVWAGPTSAQTNLVPPSAMAPLERTKERLRRLDLPPDPKFKPAVDAAYKSYSTCVSNAAKVAYKAGKRNEQDLSKAVCGACERELVEYQKWFFRANVHRYLDASLEDDTAKAKNDCPKSHWFLVEETERSLDSDPTEDQSSPSIVQKFGPWTITGEILFSGALVYEAAVTERTDARIKLRASCRPASKIYTTQVTLPGAKPEKSAFVTFSTNGGPPDQYATKIEAESFVGTNIMLAVLKSQASQLLIHVQGKRLTFDVSDSQNALKDLFESRCHIDPVP